MADRLRGDWSRRSGVISMVRQEHFNFIAGRLSHLVTEIKMRSPSGTLDLNIHGEDFYLHFLNLVFGWELVNLNAANRNAPAIDLIDSGRKLAVQVTASATPKKINSALSKQELAKYRSYSFKFVFIADPNPKLRQEKYENPHQLEFDPACDIHDCASLLATIRSFEIEKLEAISDFLARELRVETDPPNGGKSKPPALPRIDQDAYRAHIRKHYRRLHLDALAGDQIDGRNVELRHVFVPQEARECADWLHVIRDVPPGLKVAQAQEAPRNHSIDDTGNDSALWLPRVEEARRFQGRSPQNILDVLSAKQAPHRVVLGAPGAGKSSLLRVRLLAWTEGQSPQMPVLIELHRYHRSGAKDFFEYLERDPQLMFRFNREALWEMLRTGRAELLFDGLDEIAGVESRENVERQIVWLAENCQQAGLLVTSRPTSYPDRILRDSGFSHWLLADFSEAQIQAFIDHWLERAVPEPTERPMVSRRMKTALQNPGVRELVSKPLWLTLMAVLACKSDLPRDLVSLYGRMMDLLLERWDTHRALTADVQFGDVIIDQKDKRDLLRDLAWKMQIDQRGFRGNLVEEQYLRATLNAAIEHRIADSGLRRKAVALLIEQLIERNHIFYRADDSQLSFIHLTFLEYFASDHLVHILTERPEAALAEIAAIYRERAANDVWREVLILAATRFPPTATDRVLLALVENADAEEVGEAALRSRAHAFLLACAVLQRTRRPDALPMTFSAARSQLQSWISTRDKYIHADGWVSLLAATFPDETTRALLEKTALKNGIGQAAIEALQSLVKQFNDARTRSFLEQMLKSPDFISAREHAVTALAEYYPGAETREILEALARSNEDTVTRNEAVSALAQHFGDNTTRTLLEELSARNKGWWFVANCLDRFSLKSVA